jgi:hypothetical protein
MVSMSFGSSPCVPLYIPDARADAKGKVAGSYQLSAISCQLSAIRDGFWLVAETQNVTDP